MPLIAHSALPTFERLRREGHDVSRAEDAADLRGRELHIGVLNLMPDAALQATERQFLRLLCAAGSATRIRTHLFSVAGMQREGDAKTHVEAYYEAFDQIRRAGLDALIVTGANPANPVLSQEGFWVEMIEVIEWAREHVSSTVCSCLATHAVVKRYDQVERIKLPQKRWGVYSHRLLDTAHPLVAHINTRFDAPHSHVYEVTREQLEAVGIRVLAESEEAGLHLAVSEDGIRFVFFQGHPEYDINSLLKEFKREVGRFSRGEHRDFPPFPEHYFWPEAAAFLQRYRGQMMDALSKGEQPPPFPETELAPLLDNTWTDTGRALFGNWLKLVETLVSQGPALDPSDPLGLYRKNCPL